MSLLVFARVCLARVLFMSVLVCSGSSYFALVLMIDFVKQQAHQVLFQSVSFNRVAVCTRCPSTFALLVFVLLVFCVSMRIMFVSARRTHVDI